MNFMEKIVPPDDPSRLHKWRWFIFIAVLILGANAYIGRSGVWGFGKYAYADDVSEQGEKLDRVLTLQIATSLRQLQKELCSANGNKEVIEKTIEDYQQQYRDLTDDRYPLGHCPNEETS